jgi:hypothetical protein
MGFSVADDSSRPFVQHGCSCQLKNMMFVSVSLALNLIKTQSDKVLVSLHHPYKSQRCITRGQL